MLSVLENSLLIEVGKHAKKEWLCRSSALLLLVHLLRFPAWEILCQHYYFWFQQSPAGPVVNGIWHPLTYSPFISLGCYCGVRGGVKASLNRPNVPRELLRQDTEETTALAATNNIAVVDPVSNIIPDSVFHQLLLSAGRLQETSGEPDKSISATTPQPRLRPPTIIEDDIATDLEEVLSFNPT